MSLRPLVLLVTLLFSAAGFGSEATPRALGFDSGLTAQQLAALDPWFLEQSRGAWMRIRGVDLTKAEETRAAFEKLRAHGIRSCVFLRRSTPNWRTSYLPADLREAYESGRAYGAAFGDLVDAWEVDNEPDLAFVPEPAERYAAFLKATYLGLKEGIAKGQEQRAKGDAENPEGQPLPPRPSPLATRAAPLVLMGSLGLPPGPWLERFAANDGFAYTDGYNYHYYGYAEDFTGVYHQHAAAVKELSGGSYSLSGDPADRIVPNDQQPITKNGRPRPLPVFLTEIGYGMLGKSSRDTTEGRERQAAWLGSVGKQVVALGIEGPMAFYLPPYLEYGLNEYGLTVPTQKPETSNVKPESLAANPQVSGFKSEVSASAASQVSGESLRLGDWETSPAFAAWITAANRHTDNRDGGARSRAMPKPAPGIENRESRIENSRVVIDFLPGEDLMVLKRYNGIVVAGVTSSSAPPTDAPPLRPMVRPPAPPAEARREDFAVHVRTRNGNLYEVYPVRTARPDWQTYLEQGRNFTASFYGRANLPWRFEDNEPVSLVFVFYPTQLPATYEFAQVQILEPLPETASGASTSNFQLSAMSRRRFGRGEVVLYNFSDRAITGSLALPPSFALQDPLPDLLTLAPGERRVIAVELSIPADRFARHEAVILFRPDATEIPAARFVTELLPAFEGVSLGTPRPLLTDSSAPANIATIRDLPLATEEAHRKELPSGWFVQKGASVTRSDEGFLVDVTGAPQGKEQRVEVEIPLPSQGVPQDGQFLSFRFRLINR